MRPKQTAPAAAAAAAAAGESASTLADAPTC
jgi:hypothetical protein